MVGYILAAVLAFVLAAKWLEDSRYRKKVGPYVDSIIERERHALCARAKYREELYSLMDRLVAAKSGYWKRGEFHLHSDGDEQPERWDPPTGVDHDPADFAVAWRDIAAEVD